MQQEKNTKRKHCNALKSNMENRAVHKKSETRKKVEHENITAQKCATWKWCSVKKVQHEKSTT